MKNWSRTVFNRGLPPATRHFDPVQRLLHLVKRVIANLFIRTHGENCLACRLKGSAAQVVVSVSSGFPIFRIAINGSQMGDEFLLHRFRHGRSVMLEFGEPGTQGAFTRSGDFVSDRVIVSQVERPQERPKGEPLERERPEHDCERGQHDQVAKWKGRGQRQCRR